MTFIIEQTLLYTAQGVISFLYRPFPADTRREAALFLGLSIHAAQAAQIASISAYFHMSSSGIDLHIRQFHILIFSFLGFLAGIIEEGSSYQFSRYARHGATIYGFVESTHQLQ